MREIKFRAWDKAYNEMFKTDGVNDHLLDANVFALMQYTGLKDKNGVEIYEGDIVELHSWKPSIKETKRQVVEWVGSGLFMRRVDSGVSGHAELIPQRLEVIGNIYENPEMLEKAA